ncbi:hypothetical protein M5K25_020417 [Dendrobium thyrsiflorum]|uniref:Uncharacterized protein n=1 Tax=Dendrobium thyrsiflorum TaxID=117978 RepID=A0ABD0UAL7_DENTH
MYSRANNNKQKPHELAIVTGSIDRIHEDHDLSNNHKKEIVSGSFMGCGGVIKDNNGTLVLAFAGPIPSGNNVVTIIMAILYGLKGFKERSLA